MAEPDQSLASLNAVWGWTGLDAVEIFGFGFFGDVLALGRDGAVWAVSPAQTLTHPVTDDPAAVAELRNLANPTSEIFRGAILEELIAALGQLGPSDIYAMQYPASVGGKVELANFKVEPFWDYHRRMAELGAKLRDAGPGSLLMVAQGHDGKPLLEPIGLAKDTGAGMTAPSAAAAAPPPPPKPASFLGKLFGALRPGK